MLFKEVWTVIRGAFQVAAGFSTALGFRAVVFFASNVKHLPDLSCALIRLKFRNARQRS